MNPILVVAGFRDEAIVKLTLLGYKSVSLHNSRTQFPGKYVDCLVVHNQRNQASYSRVSLCSFDWALEGAESDSSLARIVPAANDVDCEVCNLVATFEVWSTRVERTVLYPPCRYKTGCS